MLAFTHPPLLSMIAWVVWLSYWMAASKGASESHWKESWLGRAQHLLPTFVGFHLLFSHGGFLNQRAIPETLSWPGLGLEVCGLLFAVWARVHLGAQWSGTITVKVDHRIIRTGPYRMIRHPIYTGFITAAFGSFMTRGLWSGLLGFFLIASTFCIKLAREERLLRKQFGQKYESYRRESWRLFPGVW